MDDKARVLLVDDSRLIRKAASKMLGQEFDLVVAEDGVEGWQKIETDPAIQVVFSDLMMPNMDGYGLLEKVRSSQDDRICQLPLIVLTGADNSDEAKEKAYAMGATDFITKPFNGPILKARAHAHVGHQRTTKTLLEQVNLDTLTGLPNKQGFESRLAKDISFVVRHQQDLAVLQVELDGFKALFDLIGRKGYDSIVKQVAKVLQGSVRKEDTVARVGLARFMVSLPTAKAQGAVMLAQRICNKTEAFNITYKGEKLPVTLSIGACTVSEGQRPAIDKVLETIHVALEKAQQQGRGKVYAQSLEGRSVETRISIDQLLRELEFNGKITSGVELDELMFTLKPIVALLSDKQKQALVSASGGL